MAADNRGIIFCAKRNFNLPYNFKFLKEVFDKQYGHILAIAHWPLPEK